MFVYILVLTFAFVSIKAEPLFDPCATNDLNCLRKATEMFMSKTYAGVPEWGLKQVDPMIIPSINIDIDKDNSVAFRYTNVTITGMKNLKINDFKIDMKKHFTRLQMQADLIITGKIEVILKNDIYAGDYSARTNVIGTATYNTHLKTINGTEYFVVGPETIDCEIHENPIVTIGNELERALENPNALKRKPEWESKKHVIRKKVLCEMTHLAFEAIVYNLRTTAEKLPKSAFFNDI